jgi:hypothetical protein
LLRQSYHVFSSGQPPSPENLRHVCHFGENDEKMRLEKRISMKKIAAPLTIIHFYVTFLVKKKVNVTLNFCSTIHARVRRRRSKPTYLPGSGGRRAELRMLP